jgi:hypothetical protein
MAAHSKRARAGAVAPKSRAAANLATARDFGNHLLFFEPFPSHHIRTNAFMLTGEMCSRMRLGKLRSKVDAYRLESGRASITRQVERTGLRAVVVTRDGHSHRVAEWPASNVFWQRTQENLLVADNQTREYERGDPDLRMLLSRYAWGESADPA